VTWFDRLVLIAAVAGTTGILLSHLFAAVLLHGERQRRAIPAGGTLPADIQRAAWKRTVRINSLIAIAALIVAADGTWEPIAAVIGFVFGAAMRVNQAEADLRQ